MRMPTPLLKNEKYEVKCTQGDASAVKITIEVGAEKLTDDETSELLTTIRKILFAFDRTESVSSRYGSIDTSQKKK